MARFREITKSSKFKALSNREKRTVTENYFDQRIEGPRFRSLGDADQMYIRQNMYDLAGIPRHDINFFENTMNSFINTIGPGRMASYYDLQEDFARANETRRGFAPTNPGFFSTVGSAGAEAVTFGSALALTVTPEPISTGAGVFLLGLLAAEQGVREAGSARRVIHEYEKRTGDTVTPAGEIYLMAGYGLTATLLNLAGGIAARGILAGTSGSLLRAIRGLVLSPTREMKMLGTGLLSKNPSMMAEALGTTLRTAGVEGIQEGSEEIIKNIMTKFIDPEASVWDNVIESVYAGAIGGGMIGSGLSGVKFLSTGQLSLFKSKRDQNKVKMETVIGDIKAGLDSGDKGQITQAVDKAVTLQEQLDAEKDLTDEDITVDPTLPPLEEADPPTEPGAEKIEHTPEQESRLQEAKIEILTSLSQLSTVLARGHTPDRTATKYEQSRTELISLWSQMHPEDGAGVELKNWLRKNGILEAESDISWISGGPLSSLEREVITDAESSPLATDGSISSTAVRGFYEGEKISRVKLGKTSKGKTVVPGTYGGKTLHGAKEVPKGLLESFLTALRFTNRFLPHMSETVNNIYLVRKWNINSIANTLQDSGYILHDSDIKNLAKQMDNVYGIQIRGSDAIVVRMDKERTASEFAGTVAHEINHAYSDKHNLTITEASAIKTEQDAQDKFDQITSPDALELLGLESEIVRDDEGKPLYQTISHLERSRRFHARVKEFKEIFEGAFGKSLESIRHLYGARVGAESAQRSIILEQDMVDMDGVNLVFTEDAKSTGDILLNRRRIIAMLDFYLNERDVAKRARRPSSEEEHLPSNSLEGVTVHAIDNGSWNLSTIREHINKEWPGRLVHSERSIDGAIGLYFPGTDMVFIRMGSPNPFHGRKSLDLLVTLTHELRHHQDFEYDREAYLGRREHRGVGGGLSTIEYRADIEASSVLALAQASRNPNLSFQTRGIKRRATTVQLHRLLVPLAKSGIFTRVMQSTGRVFNPTTGDPVNAAIDENSGTLWLSSDVDISTVGHEGAHRVIAKLGKEHPLVEKALALFDGDVEALSDAIGDYYADRALAPGLARRLSNIIQDITTNVRNLVGLAQSHGSILNLVNQELTTDRPSLATLLDQGPPPEQGLAVEEDLPRRPERRTFAIPPKFKGASIDKNVEWIGDLNRRKVVIDDAIKALDQEQFETYQKEHFGVMYDVLDQSNKLLRGGKDVIEPIYHKYLEGKGTTLVERTALRVYADRLKVDALVQFVNSDKSSDARAVLEAEVLDANKKLLFPLSEEAGTGLALWNVVSRPNELLIGQLLNLQTKKGGDNAQLNWLVDMVKEGAHEDPTVLRQMLVYLKEPKFKEYFWGWYLSSILTNIGTHTDNFSSNGLWLAFNVLADRPLAGAIGTALRPMLPANSRLQSDILIKETLPSWMAAYKAIASGSAYRTAKKLFTGTPAEKLKLIIDSKLSSIDLRGVIGSWERSDNKVAREIGKVIEILPKALMAVDVWFKVIARDAVLAGIATRKDLAGGERHKFLTDPDKESMNEADEFARMVTFTSRPGNWISAFQKSREQGPTGASYLIVPFLNTLTNIYKQGLTIVPGIGLYKLSKESDTSLANVLSRQVLGTIISAALLYLWDAEDLTDEVPSDPGERDIFFSSGRMPYAAKFHLPEGDYWLSYKAIEPFAAPIAAVSAFKRVLAQLEIDEDRAVRFEDQPALEKVQEQFTNVVSAVTSLMINSTWTENLSKIFEREIEPRTLKSLAGRTLSSFLPFSGFFRGMHRILMDSAEGDVRYREYIPGISELANTLPWTPETTGRILGYEFKPRINVMGEEVSVPGGMLREWLPIAWREAAEEDSIEEELIRLDRYPQLPHKKVKMKFYGDVPIPEEDYFEYSLAYGARSKVALGRLFKTPRYKRTSYPIKMDLVTSALDRARAPLNTRLRSQLAYKLRIGRIAKP